MTISTYDELQSAIADWLARSDLTIIPDLIRLCEDRLNYGFERDGHPLYSPPLRVSKMMTRATDVPTSEFVAVPDDFLEATLLKWNTSPEKNLKYVTPTDFANRAASATSGEPSIYTIIDSEFRIGPQPASGNTTELEIYYYAQIPALTDDNTTNWLLTKAPSVYLYGSLVHAAPYIGNDERLALWMQQFTGAVNSLQNQDRRQRWGNEASGTIVANNWVY